MYRPCDGVARGRGRLGCAHCSPILRPLHLDRVMSPAPLGVLLAGSREQGLLSRHNPENPDDTTRGHFPWVNAGSENAGPYG